MIINSKWISVLEDKPKRDAAYLVSGMFDGKMQKFIAYFQTSTETWGDKHGDDWIEMNSKIQFWFDVYMIPKP